MAEETEEFSAGDGKTTKKGMINPYELFDKLERYPAEIFKQVFLLLKKYDQWISEHETTEGFDVSAQPWEIQMAFDYNKEFIEQSCQKWLKKANAARENGKSGGRPPKGNKGAEAKNKEKKKEVKTNKNPVGFFDEIDNLSGFENNDKNPVGFECDKNNPEGSKTQKNNPVGPKFKCLNVITGSSLNSLDRDIGGMGEKEKGCITCGQDVEKFVWGEIGAEFMEKVKTCSVGCEVFREALERAEREKHEEPRPEP